MEPTIQQQPNNERLLQQTLRLAHRFSEYLTSQGIDIWLEYGSALGMAREGGMIKGDQDIDLAIWAKDWVKFKDILIKTPLGTPTFNWHIDEFGCHLNIPSSPLSIDIYKFREFDGIKCAASHLGPHTKNKSKLYHHKNLKKIKFEGLDFFVSTYVEQYLDYRYKDAAGIGKTWRTPLTSVEMEKHNSMEGNIPCYLKEDEVTGCVIGVFDLFHIGHLRLLKRSSKIFNKVVAAVHPDNVVLQYKGKLPVIPYEHRLEIVKSCKYVDDVIMAPLPENMEGCCETMVDFLNENHLDYMVHAHDKQEFLEGQFSSLIKESRLLLLPETPDYHTTDLIKIISK